MLHGKGQQDWYTNEYEEDRRKALEDRTKFTDAELADLDIEEGQGGGSTNDDNFIIKQFPFPIDEPREYVDLREVDKRIGK